MSSWTPIPSTLAFLDEEFIRCERFLQTRGRSLESLPWFRLLASALSKREVARAIAAKQVLLVLIENEGDPQIAQFMDGMLETVEGVVALIRALETQQEAEAQEAEVSLEFWGKLNLVISIREKFWSGHEQDQQLPALPLAA